MDPLDFLRLGIGTAFLGYAALSDWRTRQVRDPVWILVGTAGLVMFGAELIRDGVDAILALALVPAAVLFFGVFYGEEFVTERGWRFPPRSVAAYAIALVAAIFPIIDLSRAGDTGQLRSYALYLSPSVMILVFRAMYQAHLLKGGADAKAMISITMLVPMYPSLAPSLPLLVLEPLVQDVLAVLFPFSLLVLLNAALLLVFAPIALFAYNVSHGHVEIPEAFFGFKVPLNRVPRFVWFMDQIEGGEHVRVLFPRGRHDRASSLRALKDAGLDEAWVTPQLPFMVPLAIAYVLSFIVGNPIMGLLQALLPAV